MWGFRDAIVFVVFTTELIKFSLVAWWLLIFSSLLYMNVCLWRRAPLSFQNKGYDCLNAAVDWWPKSYEEVSMHLDNHRLQLHTVHHLSDPTASTDFVSWRRTATVKNSPSVSKRRVLINFNFLLALEGEWAAKALCATSAPVQAARTPVIINASPGLATQELEILCLFLLYPRRNKSEGSIVIFSYWGNTPANIWKYLPVII